MSDNQLPTPLRLRVNELSETLPESVSETAQIPNITHTVHIQSLNQRVLKLETTITGMQKSIEKSS